MLRLVRRPLVEVLDTDARDALAKRALAARKLSADTAIAPETRSARIGQQWDAFRAGRTSAGVFRQLWHELLTMAFQKCALCETPAPGTVEHIVTKTRSIGRTFEWDNLLPACDTCNRRRENSGITVAPVDPCAGDPLEILGWDEYGSFAYDPGQSDKVEATVEMYGLHRFDKQRENALKIFRATLVSALEWYPRLPDYDVIESLRRQLDGTMPWRGPVREFLLRPPTKNDALAIDGAIEILPEIRVWVQPWLRPFHPIPERWKANPV